MNSRLENRANYINFLRKLVLKLLIYLTMCKKILFLHLLLKWIRTNFNHHMKQVTALVKYTIRTSFLYFLYVSPNWAFFNCNRSTAILSDSKRGERMTVTTKCYLISRLSTTTLTISVIIASILATVVSVSLFEYRDISQFLGICLLTCHMDADTTEWTTKFEIHIVCFC